MAAYAALVSLMNLMEQMKNHPRHSFSFDKKQIETLHKNACFLLDFIESCNSGSSSEEAEALESLISSAAYVAADAIESHIVDQIHAGSTLNGEASSFFLVDVQKELEEMDSIKKVIMDLNAKKVSKDQLHTYSKAATSSKPVTFKKNIMVGFDDVLVQLMEMLTRQHSGRQIIPIVGMGGIGKTTLAQNAYDHLLIKQHFDVCLWATISQEYSVKRILGDLLSSQGKPTDGTEYELGEQLHKSLKGNIRYLVILDDTWSVEAWDEIQLFLPDNGNRSSIVITTRMSNMATQLRSPPFEVKFLDKCKSWKLFCEKVFGEEDCPCELDKIGKQIVRRCKGLPLSIVVIGGHLRNSLRTQEYWKEVADDLKSVLDSEDQEEQWLNVLSLSYSHLPVNLKPCFLYMGVFPEGEKICSSTLVKLWVAEGFLKPNEAQSLEEYAEVCLRDLVDRNLILVHQWSWDGMIITCYIHDLVRELCLMLAEKEKFHCALDWPGRHTKRSRHDSKLFKIQIADGFGAGRLDSMIPQVNLRFLKSFQLPSSLFKFWNLQTVILNNRILQKVAPLEIWEMPQLRHIMIFDHICLPHPPQQDGLVLRNLQTLLIIENLRFSDDVCKRIPNIKRLHIRYVGKKWERSYYCLHNLGSFKELKSLRCDFDGKWLDFGRYFAFPSCLQKLSLCIFCLDWENMTKISLSLPRLEVLKLNCRLLAGEFKGEFPRLKYLKIQSWAGSGITHWNADSSHFPVLKTLTLKSLTQLYVIPRGIGDIPTLDCIELIRCSSSAAVSAMRILAEQECLGNDGLQVKVWFWSSVGDVECRFWVKVRQEGLTCNNLLVMR